MFYTGRNRIEKAVIHGNLAKHDIQRQAASETSISTNVTKKRGSVYNMTVVDAKLKNLLNY